jgi:hypothetical protein
MKDIMTTSTNSIPTTAHATRYVRTGPIGSAHKVRGAHASTTHSSTGLDSTALGATGHNTTALGGNYVTLRGTDLPMVAGSYVSSQSNPATSAAAHSGYVTLSMTERAAAGADTIGSYVTVR